MLCLSVRVAQKGLVAFNLPLRCCEFRTVFWMKRIQQYNAPFKSKRPHHSYIHSNALQLIGNASKIVARFMAENVCLSEWIYCTEKQFGYVCSLRLRHLQPLCQTNIFVNKLGGVSVLGSSQNYNSRGQPPTPCNHFVTKVFMSVFSIAHHIQCLTFF